MCREKEWRSLNWKVGRHFRGISRRRRLASRSHTSSFQITVTSLECSTIQSSPRGPSNLLRHTLASCWPLQESCRVTCRKAVSCPLGEPSAARQLLKITGWIHVDSRLFLLCKHDGIKSFFWSAAEHPCCHFIQLFPLFQGHVLLQQRRQLSRTRDQWTEVSCFTLKTTVVLLVSLVQVKRSNKRFSLPQLTPETPILVLSKPSSTRVLFSYLSKGISCSFPRQLKNKTNFYWTVWLTWARLEDACAMFYYRNHMKS